MIRVARWCRPMEVREQIEANEKKGRKEPYAQEKQNSQIGPHQESEENATERPTQSPVIIEGRAKTTKNEMDWAQGSGNKKRGQPGICSALRD